MTPHPCLHCGHIDWAHDDVLDAQTDDLELMGWCYECGAICATCNPETLIEPAAS